MPRARLTVHWCGSLAPCMGGEEGEPPAYAHRVLREAGLRLGVNIVEACRAPRLYATLVTRGFDVTLEPLEPVRCEGPEPKRVLKRLARARSVGEAAELIEELIEGIAREALEAGRRLETWHLAVFEPLLEVARAYHLRGANPEADALLEAGVGGREAWRLAILTALDPLRAQLEALRILAGCGAKRLAEKIRGLGAGRG